MINKIFLTLLFLFATLNNNLLANHGISIFQDLKYPENFKNLDYVNPDAPKSGSIKYGVEGTFNSLNPFILKGISAAGIDMVFDSLMESSADEISSKYGLIARSAHLSNDKKSIIFKLRKEAKFHDQTPITADDVIFSFNKISQEGHPSYQMIFRNIQNAIKINNHEVKFNFKTSEDKELPVTIAGLPIISKEFYEQNKFNQTTLTPPLGSGPYKIKEIKPGKNIIYQRVKDYWAKDLPINKGRYNFDEISYDYYRDGNILIEAFKSGNFDFRQENVSRNWATAYNIDKVRNKEIIKTEISHSLPTGMQAFVINLRKNKFQNKDLRKALNYAFDFEWVRDKIFYGAYKRTNSYFVNTEFASNKLPKNKELEILKKLKNQFPQDIPNEVFNTIYQNKISDGSGYNRKNLLEAQKILQNAGYYLENDKLIDPRTKKPLEIEFLIGSKAFTMVIAPMKKNLAKLGILAKVRLVDENQYKIRINEFDYDVIVTVFGQGLIPGSEQYAYWHSSGKDIQGSRNLVGIDNKAIDYLLTKITKSTKKDELQIYTKVLDRILLWNYYTIPQWYNSSYRILYKNKFQMPRVKPPYSIAIDSWWSKRNN